MPNSTRLAWPSPARLIRATIAALSGSGTGSAATGTLNGLLPAKRRSVGGCAPLAGSGEAKVDPDAGVAGDVWTVPVAGPCTEVVAGAVSGVAAHAPVAAALTRTSAPTDQRRTAPTPDGGVRAPPPITHSTSVSLNVAGLVRLRGGQWFQACSTRS